MGLPDGLAVGVRVGPAVGASVDGELDGPTVGPPDGLAVGVRVGSAVGAPVGRALGVLLGHSVGTSVGLLDGLDDGAELTGDADGDELVGSIVGAMVGPETVGAAVGAMVGFDVGAPVVGNVDGLDDGVAVGTGLVGDAVGVFDGPALGALVGLDELGDAVGLVGTMVGETEHHPQVRAQFCRLQSVPHATSATVEPGVDKLRHAHSSRSLHSVGAMVGRDVGVVVGDEDNGLAVGDIEQRPQASGHIAMAQASPHTFSLANLGHKGMSMQDVGAELGAADGAVGAMVGADVGQASQLCWQSCSKLAVAQCPPDTSAAESEDSSENASADEHAVATSTISPRTAASAVIENRNVGY